MNKKSMMLPIALVTMLLSVGLAGCGVKSSSSSSNAQSSKTSSLKSSSVVPSSSSVKPASSSVKPSSSTIVPSSSVVPSSSALPSSSVAPVAIPLSAEAGTPTQIEAENGQLGAGMETGTATSGTITYLAVWPAGATYTLLFSAPAAATYTVEMQVRGYKPDMSSSTVTPVDLSTIEFKLNGVVVAVTGTTGTSFAKMPIGDLNVATGNNTLTIKAPATGSGPGIDYFIFTKKAA